MARTASGWPSKARCRSLSVGISGPPGLDSNELLGGVQARCWHARRGHGRPARRLLRGGPGPSPTGAIGINLDGNMIVAAFETGNLVHVDVATGDQSLIPNVGFLGLTGMFARTDT